METYFLDFCISFPQYETYNVEYLEKILTFLINQIKVNSIEFVNGKGHRKTPLQKYFEQIEEFKNKLNEYNEWLQTIGPDRNSCVRTDKDATFMHMKEDHMRNGQLKSGYNIQIGVTNEYILHIEIFQNRSDYKTFIPFMAGYKTVYGFYPQKPVTDAGYGGLVNYRFVKANQMQIYQKYTMYSKEAKDKKYISDPSRPCNFEKDDNGYYINHCGEKLTFKYIDKQGNHMYFTDDNKKKYRMNAELWKLQAEARKNIESDIGIELRLQRSIQV